MKSKGSLYEVLKAATAGPASAAGGPPPAETSSPADSAGDPSKPQTLKDRLAAYKAKKMAAINQAVGEQTPPPPPATPPPPPPPPMPTAEAPALSPFVVPFSSDPATPPPALFPPDAKAEPVPAPVPEPAPVETPEPPPSRGPGERVIRLTYNTAAFSALVVIGLVFVAYALGVQSGRASAAAGPEEPAPKVAPGPVRHYSILLAEWPAVSARDRVNANYAADQLSRAVRRARLGTPRTAPVKRNGKQYLALYLGDTTDPLSEENRTRIKALRAMKVANTTPFAKAGFEEMK